MAAHAALSPSLAIGATPRFATVAIPTDQTRYPYNHASSIVEAPNGDMLVAWVAGSKEAAADTVIVASRRRKGETQWSPPTVVSDNAGQGHANPVLFFASPKIWLFYSELVGDGQLCLSTIRQRFSLDGGESWSAARVAVNAMCILPRNKPVVLRSGEWLFPLYWQAVYQSQFWTSVNNGDAWLFKSAIGTFPSSNLQPAAVQCADGSLFALMRNGSETGFTWEARSEDCGGTWTTKERRDIPNPGSALDMIRLSSGELLAVCNPSTSERTPLSVILSADDGKTWTVPRAIATGEPQLSYPSVIQASDGMIHVSYSHRLTHIQHAEFNAAWLAGNTP